MKYLNVVQQQRCETLASFEDKIYLSTQINAMITRIPETTKTTKLLATQAPTCNKSKSRAMQSHKKNDKKAAMLINAGHQQQQQTPKKTTRRTTIATRTTSTMYHLSLAVLQVLLFACALPPPFRTSLPLLPKAWTLGGGGGGGGAVEALPITSKPIESTAENLAWQAWLMLPPEQKLLEKSRKVTPKSIFSLPFRECPPGHQLFQSRCIPTVNINQSDLLTQQVLGLFLGGSGVGGADGAGGGNGGGGVADNAYEFDYGEDEYSLGLGEGGSILMYDTPQPYNGASAIAGTQSTQPQQQEPQQQQHVRDEPLKFNLFEQKYPTSDYEADISGGSAMEGSGGGGGGGGGGFGDGQLQPALANVAEGGERVESATAPFYNSSQLLDVVQGFLKPVDTDISKNRTLTPPPPNVNNTTYTNKNHTAAESGSKNQQPLSGDLKATSSNISAFAVHDIDAIILPAVGSNSQATVTALTHNGAEGVDADGVGSAVGGGGDLEPQRISLFKDNSSLQLLTTVIAQAHHGEGEAERDGQGKGDTSFGTRMEAESLQLGGDAADDLVAAAAQQHQQNSVAQFLRADALLPLSSVAPFDQTTETTTTRAIEATTQEITEKTTTTTTPATSAIPTQPTADTTKILTPQHTKDEHPRSVLELPSADTDAQETSFITTTEPDSTTNIQIDETTIVETYGVRAVDEFGDDFAAEAEKTSLLEAISQQQQLEFQKSKVESAATTKTTTDFAQVSNAETTTTTPIAITTTEATTIVPELIQVNAEKYVDETKTNTEKEVEKEKEKETEKEKEQATTTTQPLPSSAAVTQQPIQTTTTTTTAKSILATTPHADRFHSNIPATAVTPAAAVASAAAVVTPRVHATLNKQVSDAVAPLESAAEAIVTNADDVGQTAAAAAAATTAGEIALAFSEEAVHDKPTEGGSGSKDLVNVSNKSNDKNVKNAAIRSVSKKAAGAAVPAKATSEINIEQELRMINELVKGKRQLAAMKMAAIKTTEIATTRATEITTTTTATPLIAGAPKLALKKFANTAENLENGSDDDDGDVEAAVEVWQDIDGATTTTATKVATTNDGQPKTTNSDVSASETTIELSDLSGVEGTTTAQATQSQNFAKMESARSELAAKTRVVSEDTNMSKIIELVTKTTTTTTTTETSAPAEYETEATATSIHAEAEAEAEAVEGGATIWSRIMPLFGFGGNDETIVEVEETEAEVETTTTKTVAPTTTQEHAGSTTTLDIGSISSNSDVNNSSDSSKSSISNLSNRFSSISDNEKSIISDKQKNRAESPIRRNSKIIQIDHLSDESNNVALAAAATTTNTLEEAPAAAGTTTATTQPNAGPQSTYWWLPAGWRLDAGTKNLNQQPPLLFRLWSAFPESQMKAKVSA